MIEKIKQLLSPSVDTAAKLAVVSIFFGRLFERFENRIGALESRQLQKGDKGDQGPQGVAGRDGKDALKAKDGRDGKDGKDGKNGRDGKEGKGVDGVSVVDAEVAIDGHLVFKLSNDKIIDAGELPSVSATQHILSQQLSNYQITVSSDAPASPQLNDLWLPILE